MQSVWFSAPGYFYFSGNWWFPSPRHRVLHSGGEWAIRNPGDVRRIIYGTWRAALQWSACRFTLHWQVLLGLSANLCVGGRRTFANGCSLPNAMPHLPQQPPHKPRCWRCESQRLQQLKLIWSASTRHSTGLPVPCWNLLCCKLAIPIWTISVGCVFHMHQQVQKRLPDRFRCAVSLNAFQGPFSPREQEICAMTLGAVVSHMLLSSCRLTNTYTSLPDALMILRAHSHAVRH